MPAVVRNHALVADDEAEFLPQPFGDVLPNPLDASGDSPHSPTTRYLSRSQPPTPVPKAGNETDVTPSLSARERLATVA